MGDVDGDGLDDLLVTDDGPQGGPLDEAGLFVLHGGTLGMVVPLQP